jgi:catechol 2,3-dioxygenase-like lactoylglutathione lyase family enzyme
MTLLRTLPEGRTEMRLDHVVLHVQDPSASAEWFRRVVGLEPVRLEEYRRGDAPFPSVRVSEDAIIDLSPLSAAPDLEQATGVPGSVGHRVNHVCIALTRAEYDALDERLRADGKDTSARIRPTYGARGWAPENYYFTDLDDNVFEARYYD